MTDKLPEPGVGKTGALSNVPKEGEAHTWMPPLKFGRRVERALTADEMAACLMLIKKAPDPIEGLLVALRFTFNALLLEFGESWEDYSPERPLISSQYGIPAEQWKTIAKALMDTMGPNPLDRASMAMEWMNRGPSGYDPGEEH